MRVDLSCRMSRVSRRVLVLLISLLFVPAVLFAETRAYRIEPSPDSRFALEVYKTGLMNGKKHLLVFERYQGRIEYDAANPAQSRVELTIQSASLSVQDDWVNENERKKIADEALNKQLIVEQHPELKFHSGSIRPADAPGHYEVQGELTIRNLARPVIVQVTMSEPREGVLLFEGDATVEMKDYGLKPPSAALGLIGTKNEMKVIFQLHAVPAGP
ncbi:MAG: YceI family protein [Bryobacterales bacterium]